ncbi:MAG: class I SAM-dependent methyltransferase [Candidatus Micrarchaeota archaeon]
MKLEGGGALDVAHKGDGKDLLNRRSPAGKEDPKRSDGFASAHPQVEPAVLLPTQVIHDEHTKPVNDQTRITGPSEERESCEGKCHPPDDRYIGECYQRILGIDNSGTRSEVIAGINEILSEMANTAETDNCSYASMVCSLLMLHWTRKEGDSTSYDKFMQEHVEAIIVLIKAMMKNKQIGAKFRILDASCGTGKVLEAVLDAMPKKALRRLRIVANDVSAAAIEETEKTLAKYGSKLKVEYRRYDLTQDLPDGRFDLIILSQTLALICDEKALRDKRLGREVPYESRHNTAKRKLLEALFAKVKPGKGEFWLIDEDPMRLSELPEDFYGIVEDTLFREIFTECNKKTLVNEVMKMIKESRFKAHVECYIDRKHIMYLINSTSIRNHDISSDQSCGCDTPQSIVPGMFDAADVPNEEQDDDRYIKKITSRMRVLHPEIAARLQLFEGANGTIFKPIQEGEKMLPINRNFYDTYIDHKPGFWRTNGHYNLVIIAGLAHHLGPEGYRCLIDKLHKSNKIGPGSALLFIDTFPAPPGSPEPMGNSDARSLVFSADNHVFCGSVRYGDKYGYLYVVKEL